MVAFCRVTQGKFYQAIITQGKDKITQGKFIIYNALSPFDVCGNSRIFGVSLCLSNSVCVNFLTFSMSD